MQGREAVKWGAVALVLVASQANPISSANVDASGSVSIACIPASAYTVALTAGAGTYSARRMASGSHSINYNLYRDAARTTVWGDGSGSTALVSDSAATATYPVYGRIPGSQSAAGVGTYSDTITVTVSF
jgi:spore coat protein U-like protein